MGEASNYGQYYWTVRTPDSLIRIHADQVDFEDGAAIFRYKRKDGETEVNFALAPGQWLHVYAASVLDGGAVAVEHWDPVKPSRKTK